MQQWLGIDTSNSTDSSGINNTNGNDCDSSDADIERVLASNSPTQQKAIDTYLDAVRTQDHVLLPTQGTYITHVLCTHMPLLRTV
jgi:hypothetical protein